MYIFFEKIVEYRKKNINFVRNQSIFNILIPLDYDETNTYQLQIACYQTVSSIYNVSAIMEQQILFARGRILCRIKYCRWDSDIQA